MPSAYDERAIRAALDAALRPFIPSTTIPSGADAVIDIALDASLDALELICGKPGGIVPRGLMSAPTAPHRADTADPGGYGHAV